MVKINRIYTRTGDRGETGLVDGSRRSKADPLMAAIGDVDEANCAIGLAAGRLDRPEFASLLERIQNDLFDLGADLATPLAGSRKSEGALRILPAQVERLEREIDGVNATLEPLRTFILPAGEGGSAELHMARAVVRRAERSVARAAEAEAVSAEAMAYLNRLSDLLFVLARRTGLDAGGERLWKPGAHRGL